LTAVIQLTHYRRILVRRKAGHRQLVAQAFADGNEGSTGCRQRGPSDGAARRERRSRSPGVYRNALSVYGLNTEMKEEHWLAPSAIDQRSEGDGTNLGLGREKIDTNIR